MQNIFMNPADVAKTILDNVFEEQMNECLHSFALLL